MRALACRHLTNGPAKVGLCCTILRIKQYAGTSNKQEREKKRMRKTEEELRVIAIRAHGQVERYAETGRRLTSRMCHQHGTRYCDCCPNCGARGLESHEDGCWRDVVRPFCATHLAVIASECLTVEQCLAWLDAWQKLLNIFCLEAERANWFERWSRSLPSSQRSDCDPDGN